MLALPDGLAPRPPEPPADRVRAAMLAIADMMARDPDDECGGAYLWPDGDAVVLSHTAPLIARGGDEGPYRWAFSRMLDAGLLTLIIARSPRAGMPTSTPHYCFRSTPALWDAWRSGFAGRTPPAGQCKAPASVPATRKKAGRGKNVNACMAAALQDNPDARGWSAEDWAGRLGCAKSSVIGTKTWRLIQSVRKMDAADAAGGRGRPGSSGRRVIRKRPDRD